MFSTKLFQGFIREHIIYFVSKQRKKNKLVLLVKNSKFHLVTASGCPFYITLISINNIRIAKTLHLKVNDNIDARQWQFGWPKWPFKCYDKDNNLLLF